MSEPGSKVPMQECRFCGKGYAPAKLVAAVCKKAKVSDELARTCPACRRRRFAEKVVKSLTPAASGAGSARSDRSEGAQPSGDHT